MATSEPVVETVQIRARPETVFRYFTEPAALVQWLGERAELEPHPGGDFVVSIRGETVRGQYVEVDPPRRLRITWGREGSSVVPPGSSEIDVRLDAVGDETLVTLVHRGLPAQERQRHQQGWRYFLPLLGQCVPTAREGGTS